MRVSAGGPRPSLIRGGPATIRLRRHTSGAPCPLAARFAIAGFRCPFGCDREDLSRQTRLSLIWALWSVRRRFTGAERPDNPEPAQPTADGHRVGVILVEARTRSCRDPLSRDRLNACSSINSGSGASGRAQVPLSSKRGSVRTWRPPVTALPTPRLAGHLGSVLAAIGRELNRPKSTKKGAVA
jgi:hypothetical protein